MRVPSRRAVLLTTVVGVVVVAVGAGGLAVSSGTSTADPASTAARSYLSAWSRADPGGMAALLDRPPADLAARVGSLDRSAPGSRGTFELRRVTGGGTGRVAAYHARVDVAAFGPVEWDGQVPLTKLGGRWVIRWQPDDLYPGLTEGQHLAVERTWPQRAPILGGDGTPLVSDAAAVAVGIEPDRMTDIAAVQAALRTQLGIDPAAVQRAVSAPGVKPAFFVPITTVAADRFTGLRPQLAPIPGIVFQKTHGRLPVAEGLAPQILGTVGSVTAERLRQLGSPYRAGDTVGLSGIEAVYETRLAGSPAQDVAVVGVDGTVAHVVAHHPGADPQPVQLTLDVKTQQAAESALAGVSQPAALVAVDAATGALRAVVSHPADQAFDRALDGRYPPGSTFKIVTAAALLANGTTSSTPAPCPPQLSVGGLRFRNFEGEAPGAIPFHTAFSTSCNTAFVGLASHLPADALSRAAAQFGFGAPDQLAVPSIGGSFPPPADPAEAAAAAIGQAKVTASPMHMATVGAAVASGQWHPPVLVLQPAPQAASGPAPAALDPAVATELRSLMSEVVTGGTGTAAAVAGQTVSGKTGTAEFGTASPPQTHAWFVGFRGGLAFAILVEGGGVGGRTAAPITARFLAAVPAS